MTDLKDAISTMLDNKCDISYGKLDLCNLSNFIGNRINLGRKYQVVCDDYRFRMSEIYVNRNVAIDKFIGIKNLLDEKSQ